jgi:hypothetical protein
MKLSCARVRTTVAVERRLEGEVEAGERFDGGEPGHHQRRLDAPALTDAEFLGEQGIDGVQCRDLCAFELTDDLIEDLEGAGHLQADQGAADPFQDRRDNFGRAGHDCSPWPARRRPTAA